MLDSAVPPTQLPRLHVSHRDGEGGLCVLTVQGEVDLATAPTLKGALLASVARGATRFVLELSGVSHMDSTGLGVLVGVQRRLPEDGQIAVAGAPANVCALFKLTGLERTFTPFPTLEAAVAHVRGAAPSRPRPSLSADGALVVGLASTAVPFADSPAAEAERWLRILRLHGDAGRALTALGLGEAPLVEIAPSSGEDSGEEAHPQDRVARVTEYATQLAAERGCAAVGTAELLLGVMAVYGRDFERVLHAHGGDQTELTEHLQAA